MQKIPSNSTINDKISRFFKDKTTKLTTKKAFIYYLGLHNIDWEKALNPEIVSKINDKILEIEIEFELDLINDKSQGGKRIYADKYISNNMDSSAQQVFNINFGKDELVSITEEEKNA